ncbi:aminotransferase-like domain-containing protein [Roseomonas marmotae]|uniref:PLP-dependent aminotransferase family protein n=1 Tax=Roseomonas marmotae TaxID=2768161 RepID=A0ABS3KB17_9PROT|nr:PLP-dependent aminotransferase family protein [Roseomonas marmotae]MBO1074637.1 PLP-dependent aminotransferase family protein [Roseomonas marmotae]QTI81658.1 PLP-dependent aminotransferase family protein [Roseomonas marmotae]
MPPAPEPSSVAAAPVETGEALRVVLGGASRLVLELDRHGPRPLADQIAERLASLIRAGSLTQGTRLPSIRALAGRSGVSIHSVVEAYARLAAMGLSVSRAGSGVYVVRPAAAPAAAPPPEPDPLLPEGAAAAMMDGWDDALAPGSGFLPGAWMEGAWQGGVLNRFARHLPAAMPRPSPPQGGEAIRQQISLKLGMRGILMPPDGVLMTSGATQALDLVMQAHLSPGDTVLVEDPGFFMLFPMLARRGARMVPIPRRADGPCLEAVAAACRSGAPKLFFLQSVLHNPTGWTATASNLHHLLRLAETHGLLLVEDDIYGDLHPGEPVRLIQLDGGASVIYISSFGKLIGGAARLGFLATSAARARELLRAKVMTALTGSGMEELLVLEVLSSGQYRRHVETLRARLSSARGLVTQRLRELGFSIEGGDGGLFLWAEAPEGVPDDLTRRARRQGLFLAAGTLFRPGGRPSRHFRFNVGRSTDPRIPALLRGLLHGGGTPG